MSAGSPAWRAASGDVDPGELPARLARAQEIADSVCAQERCHIEWMIEVWRTGVGSWPSWSAMTPLMQVVANILRGVTPHEAT